MRPVITVWCLPDAHEKTFNDLHKAIVGAVLKWCPYLKGEQDMTVLFPSDKMAYGLGTDVPIDVERMNRSSLEERKGLARDLVEVVRRFLPEALVECIVRKDNVGGGVGFWSSAEKSGESAYCDVCQDVHSGDPCSPSLIEG